MRRAIAIAVVAALAFTVTSVAAQWVADGTGEGAATAGTAEGLVITPGIPVTLLYPGGSGDVALTITNSNSYDVEVIELEVTGPVVSTDAACEAAGHEVTAEGATGSWLVPANDSIDVVLTDAASMGVNAANECQGAEFRIPFVLG